MGHITSRHVSRGHYVRTLQTRTGSNLFRSLSTKTGPRIVYTSLTFRLFPSRDFRHPTPH